jgi:hypothetical protein
MNQTILKRHQHQVSRAKKRAGSSESGLRRPESAAARGVGRSVAGRHCVPRAHYAAPSIRNAAGPSAEGAPKAEKV